MGDNEPPCDNCNCVNDCEWVAYPNYTHSQLEVLINKLIVTTKELLELQKEVHRLEDKMYTVEQDIKALENRET